jgi:hypothetical protein
VYEYSLQVLLCSLGIPALVPVVEDVFLVRGTCSTSSFDLKELDTQREVLVSMLLRLVEYHQVSPDGVFSLDTMCSI